MEDVGCGPHQSYLFSESTNYRLLLFVKIKKAPNFHLPMRSDGNATAKVIFLPKSP